MGVAATAVGVNERTGVTGLLEAHPAAKKQALDSKILRIILEHTLHAGNFLIISLNAPCVLQLLLYSALIQIQLKTLELS
jgi:hypothetical protein